VVIHDLYPVRSAIPPLEANAPLIVNADAVLTGTVCAQFLKPIGWRYAKIIECGGTIQHAKFA